MAAAKPATETKAKAAPKTATPVAKPAAKPATTKPATTRLTPRMAPQKHAKGSTPLDPYVVIKYPLSTEKGIRLMEAENKLLFVIDSRATKKDVRHAIEKLYGAKVVEVNTLNQYGQKRAYITFSAETPAINVATNLGLI